MTITKFAESFGRVGRIVFWAGIAIAAVAFVLLLGILFPLGTS